MAHDVLIVDDEADIRTLVSGILEDEGYQTRLASSVEEALQEMTRRMPTLVLLDVWLGHVDGLVFLRHLRSVYPHLPVVMMSGHGTFEMAVSAIKQGACDFIEKPFQVDRLLLSLKRALENQALRSENALLRQKLLDDDMVWGASLVMQTLKHSVEKVAPTNSRILINGESGTGKEMLAREIHRLSKRSQGPFVVAPCARLVPTSFEEELFGVERPGEGAYKVGLLEQAHGGTLFLSSVQDMPLVTQGKILRVLQEQTFKRVGGAHPVQVDVRFVASTGINLQDAIAQELFREDLYYRLNVVSLEVAPLRERREDVEALAPFFLKKMCVNFERSARQWAAEAVVAMQIYDWPGNIREVKNVIERALIFSPDDTPLLTLDLLPPEIQGVVPATLDTSQKNRDILSLPLKQARESFEKQYLCAQVSRFEGNISKTAHFVGMERSALHRKLKDLQVASGRKKEEEASE